MEGHPIPRQITTFEFKLIGFLTLRQFIYLIVFGPLGFVIYKLFPIPFVNIALGVAVGAIGPLFAFVPINDRPIDVWIRNFIKRLTSPTQYTYYKHNAPLYFLQNLYFIQDPHRVVTHIESQEKLAAYLASRQKPQKTNVAQKQTIHNLLHASRNSLANGDVKKPAATVVTTPGVAKEPSKPPLQPQQTTIQPTISSAPQQKQPFFSGVVKNHKLIPLPGILIYVKNDTGQVLRLLKTNPHGVFATFSPLSPGQYFFELKDPRGSYFFDTMKIPVESQNSKPFEFFSNELL